MSSSTLTSTIKHYIYIDLIEPILLQSQTQKLKDSAPLHAHGLVQWLLSFYFPAKIRKSKQSTNVKSNYEHEIISVTSHTRGTIQIEIQFISLHKDNGEENKEEEDKERSSVSIHVSRIKEQYEKSIRSTLKKIVVDDLGHLNATELLPTIPKIDPEGRGLDDLLAIERKLNVKVVFDVVHVMNDNSNDADDDDVNESHSNSSGTNHVLIVGDAKKIEKKVFVIRNMISHYHWRLSGKDNVGSG